ncbi:MAG: hypothetical protein HN380_07495 [Victivallales bacterium]|jgi:serine/threonine protein phosphatase 1|nr:hypothetical protein [Victivallales bacterium]
MGGSRVWAIGDIHGMFDPLCAILQHIRYLDSTLDEPAKIVFLGDYIDYGPSPRQVVDSLLRLKGEREVVFLCGNHEDLMLQFLSGSPLFQKFGNVWFRGNGGQDTVASFTQSPDVFRRIYRTPEEYCNISPDEFQLDAKYLAFFTGLRYGHVERFPTSKGTLQAAFCHASLFQPSPDPAQPALSDSVTVEQQLALHDYDQFHGFCRDYDMWIENTHIWNRSEPRGRFGDHFLVQGHTPTCCLVDLGLPIGDYDVDSGLPFVTFNRPNVMARLSPRRLYLDAAMDEVVSVNIDTGAVYGGSLTALGIGSESLAMGELDVIQARVGGNHRSWSDVEHFVMRFSGGLHHAGQPWIGEGQAGETGAFPAFKG